MSTTTTSPRDSGRRTATATRSVLHVLPHPGGGGETYVDLLERMDGYRFERRYLVDSPRERRPDRLLAAAARMQIEARKHDLVHAHGEAAGFLSLPVLVGKPSLLTLHGLNILRRSSGPRRVLALVNLRAVVSASHRTICVSETEYEQVGEVLGARTMRKVVLIRNGVFLPAPPEPGTREAVRRELGISETAVVALAVGGLEPVKDPLTAARAAIEAARDTELVLCFAGEGPLRSELDALAGDDGGEALRVLGQRSDVERLYAAADVLVLASLRETLGYAVLEGMAHRLAPIVSDGIGCEEAAGDAAIVARCGDEASFAAALQRLARDPAERAARGARARERVAARFRADEMLARSRVLYDKVLSLGAIG